MTRAWLLVLACAAAATAAAAASYGDYSGVKMPQYSGSADYDGGREPAPALLPDDYNNRPSPDLPAPLDYKYEEEPPGSKTEKPEDSDMWRKSGRKQRDSMRPVESDSNERLKYDRDDEEIPKLRTNRRYSKHRPRLKSEIDQREEETSQRRHNKYSRDRKDISDVDRKDYFSLDKDYSADDKNKDFDDDEKFVRELTTRKLNRRKARDRLDDTLITRRRNLLEEYQEELEARRHMKNELEKEEKDVDPVERPRPTQPRIPAPQRTRSPLSENEDEAKDSSSKSKPKAYDEYDDYYDMKRVHNMKNKLPSLLRRTTEAYPVRTNHHLLDMLLTNRRMGVSRLVDPDEAHPTRSSARIRTTDTTTESTSSTTTTTTSGTTTTVTTTTVNTLPSRTPGNMSRELSLAEKSRLSIMKKAQRKEGMGFHSTKKPPVLLQVTSQMPTVVMVEPPTPAPPFMRAREFDEDTPERVEMVKRLMRHKLVAEAKSIHDLTDNWDDMVCDYIDTSLLENAVQSLKPNMCSCILFLRLCLFLFDVFVWPN